jgi:hypothetical protein
MQVSRLELSLPLENSFVFVVCDAVKGIVGNALIEAPSLLGFCSLFCGVIGVCLILLQQS